ncbi:MAG: hypothetical protein ACOC8D_00615 [bacterium]
MRCAPCPVLLPVLLAVGLTASGAQSPSRYGPARQLCILANEAVDESSGLACSRRHDGVFWTHNDSGDQPRLYAFNRRGEHLATVIAHGAIAQDWEDMASFRLDGKPYLLVADVGDNKSRRPYRTLYVLPEPPLDLDERDVEATARISLAIEFTYRGGPQNCEAVAVEPARRRVLLITKTLLGPCRVYVAPLKASPRDKPFVLQPIATLLIPTVTAMDLAPDGRRAAVLTYRGACVYTRRPDETWAEALARAPSPVRLPRIRQPEALCYGPDGHTLYLTSEKTPTPLLEVPLRQPKDDAPAAP